MSNLYQIQIEYLQIMEILEETDGEITEELELRLQALEENKDILIESLCKKHADLIGDVSKIKDEVKRLNDLKKTADNKIETVKRSITKLLKFFDMKSSTRNATNYAFNTGLFSGYTRMANSVEIDEIAFIDRFKPIIGKSSKHVDYEIRFKANHEQLLKINDLGIIPVSSYTSVANKNSIKEYLTKLKSHDSENATEIEYDPIADVADISENESLIIK